MLIFNESKLIVQAVESNLLNETNNTIPVIGNIKRRIWLPTKFLRIGFEEISRSAMTWAVITFILLSISLWITKNVPSLNNEMKSAFRYVAYIVPIVLATFSVPSIYAHSGIKQLNFEFVFKHLEERGFAHVNEIELLKKSVKLLEDRCRSRLNSLKWIVGLLWAAFIYSFSGFFEHTPSTHLNFEIAILKIVFETYGVFIAYFFVWGYGAALDRLFRTIEFGCNDFCYLLETQ
jgi:hypothetical protein